jgi:hypothetical protein
MPYKDPQQKWQWEQRHRTHRVARRRELRRIEAARQAAQPAPPEAGISGAAFILPMIAGGVLAAHNPVVAMGAGGLTVFVAATYKKDWRWWVVGILILALAAFSLLNKKDENK